MASFWKDHVTWTRLAIISLTTDSPDTQATVGRLLRNQSDLGNAIKPSTARRPDEAGRAPPRAHPHRRDLIAAAQKGDQEAVASQQARWQTNADEIAAFLSSSILLLEPGRDARDDALPSPADDDECSPADEQLIGACVHHDRVHVQILGMADMLPDGLVAQFPSRFRCGPGQDRHERDMKTSTRTSWAEGSSKPGGGVTCGRRFPLPAAPAARPPSTGTDLHALLDLVERGCPGLAERILAPLDEADAA